MINSQRFVFVQQIPETGPSGGDEVGITVKWEFLEQEVQQKSCFHDVF